MPPTRAVPSRVLATVAGAAVLAAGTTAPADAQGYPGHTESRYAPLDSIDPAAARKVGCSEGATGRDGVRVLFFGTQVKDNQLRKPGISASTKSKHLPTSRATEVASAWAGGFAKCRTKGATADLALAVNTKDDGGVAASTAGRAWASVVENSSDAVDASERAGGSAVTITGGVDAEPIFSPPSWARQWVKAFTGSTSRTLYAATSADGCPESGSSSTTCANGWKVADVHFVSSGAAPTVRALPQIYRTDGIQARQWARISAWGAGGDAGPVRFAGSLSQHTACKQRGGCTRTDNTAKAAWTQLRQALNATPATKVDSLPTASDVRWP